MGVELDDSEDRVMVSDRCKFFDWRVWRDAEELSRASYAGDFENARLLK